MKSLCSKDSEVSKFKYPYIKTTKMGRQETSTEMDDVPTPKITELHNTVTKDKTYVLQWKRKGITLPM